MIGYFISFLFILLFYSLITMSIYLSSYKTNLLTELKKGPLLTGIFVIIIFLGIFTNIYAQENFIYYWDYGSYWYKTLDFSNTLFNDPTVALSQLYSSINSEEYNFLLCVLIALPLKIAGSSYFAFIIINIIMFYIPWAFMISYVFYITVEKYSIKHINIVWIFFISLLWGVALIPVLDGYIDIATMLPLCAAYLLVIDRSWGKIEWAKDFLLGCCILTIILFRRYFAYSVIGGAVFAISYWLTEGINNNDGDKFDLLKKRAIDMTVSISVVGIVLLIFFKDFLIMSIFNNYSVAYSAYKSTDYLGEWFRLVKWYGLFNISLAMAGLLTSYYKTRRYLVISLVLNLLVTCSLFFFVQDMGEQHYYTNIFILLFLILMGINNLAYSNRCKKIIPIVLICVGINFLSFLGIENYGSFLWQAPKYEAKSRNDIDVLKELETYLGVLNEQGYSGVYCLGSSGIINNDILYKLNAPNFSIPYICMNVSQVDLRDGFNTNFFDANVILACDPPQYHLSNGQDLLLKLNEIFLEGNVFNENYQLKETFCLDNNVNVMVYVKVRPLNHEDIEYIRNICHELYPDYPDLFEERIDLYLSETY